VPKLIARVAAWVAPLALCLALFHRGLTTWFVQDDFTSLLLAMRIPGFADALRYLFQPLAQGVVRPLPDVFFYWVMYRLAGLDAVPYRIVVFVTQGFNLLLLTAVARRLSGSLASGSLAGLLWAANVALVVGLTWTSAYSQILCCTFLLAGFWLFLKHVETGRWVWWWCQCAAFLGGLLTLEIALVYPAIVGVYCFLSARRFAWRAVPLAALSVVIAAVRLLLVPQAEAGPYVMRFDASLIDGLLHYWAGALGAGVLTRNLGWSRLRLALLVAVFSGVLLWGFLAAPPARRKMALLGAAWFLLTLAPVLPLGHQRMDYYLTVPTIGLALAAAALLAVLPRWTAAAWLGLYAICSIRFLPAGVDFWVQRSHDARRLVEGARAAHFAHPDRVLLLSGVDERLFYAAVYDQGFNAVGAGEVYLLPDTPIRDVPGFRRVETYGIPLDQAKRWVAEGRAEVYRVTPTGALANITAEFSASRQISQR
jgi:hypothetical protein